MKRKNKVMLALAIGAVALVVGSGVTRCSLAPDAGAPEQAQHQEQAQEATNSGAEAGNEGALQAGVQGGFADLKNTSWESEDGKSALSIIEGALIETSEGGQAILYYTIDSEKVSSSAIEATLSVSSSMTGDEEKMVAIVTKDPDGALSIACDKLKCSYRLKADAVEEIQVVGATDDLYSTFEEDEGTFESLLLEYARANTPSATSAAWGKEVWIDFASHTCLTNFTLDDAASTIVTVQKDASGKLATL